MKKNHRQTPLQRTRKKQGNEEKTRKRGKKKDAKVPEKTKKK